MKTFTRFLIFCCCLAVLASAAYAQNAPSTVKDKEDQQTTINAYNPEFAATNESLVAQKNAQLTLAATSDPVSMPAISAPSTTTTNGTIVVTFDGAILPAQLNELWGKVVYNGKTEYWKLDPGMISDDGRKFTMQFDPRFNGMSFKMQLYGFRATDNSKTNLTNTVVFTIASPTTLTMPAISSAATSTSGGTVNCTLAAAVKPEQLKELWAKVNYDSKTEYWKLDPGMLSEDGKTFSITFDPKFNGKTVSLALFGYAAADGSQTNTTNSVTVKINAASGVTMPSITAAAATDSNQTISFGFSSEVNAQSLKSLWAKVSYDNKTEYWQLDPGMISPDGKSMSLEFESGFINRTITLQLYGYAADNGGQTNLTNAVTFKVLPASSSVTIPSLPATASTDSTGKVTVAFSSGTLQASQLKSMWVEARYDGKVEYWEQSLSQLSADGTSVTFYFGEALNGKTVRLSLYGFDTKGIETGFSNPIDIKVTVKPEGVTMPTVPSTAVTDAEGNLTLTFASGTLQASQLKELWARVKIDGKTSTWKLDPAALSADGKSVTLAFGEEFDGKVITMELFGVDNYDVQTGYTNPVNITVHSKPERLSMPVLPSTATTDAEGKLTVTFASGTLKASDLSEFAARVKYDGKTEYWVLDTASIADDGKSVYLEFAEKFDGKTITMEFYGKDLAGVQTAFSNPIAVTVHSKPDRVVMPQIPASATTDKDGSVSIAFASGAVTPSQLSELWAQVTYDNKTEYWNIGTGVLSDDGKTITMGFTDAFNNKTLQIRFFGKDTKGIQTTFTNSIFLAVKIPAATVAMPVIPSSASTDIGGGLQVSFLSGTLLPSQLSAFWAEVTYDSKTYYWEITPDALSADGTGISMELPSELNGKQVKIRFFGFDLNDIFTGFSNTLTISKVTA